MNNYPGQGLGAGHTVLGLPLGYAYPSAPEQTLCKIYGTILGLDGEPVGNASRTLGSGGLVDGWNGVKVSAKLSAAVDSSGAIIAPLTLTVTTNEAGYFEIYAVQGTLVTVSSLAFATQEVDTTALTSFDLSTRF